MTIPTIDFQTNKRLYWLDSLLLFLFTANVFSPYFKRLFLIPTESWIVYQITFSLLAVTLLAYLFTYYRTIWDIIYKDLTLYSLLFSFFIYAVFSLFWVEHTTYGTIKLVRLFLLGILPFGITHIFFSKEKKSLNTWLMTLFILQIPFCLYAISLTVITHNLPAYILNHNYQAAGYIINLTLIISNAYLLKAKTLKQQATLVSFNTLLLIFMLMLGSRQALLAYLCAKLLTQFFIYNQLKRYFTLTTVFEIFLTIAVFFTVPHLNDNFRLPFKTIHRSENISQQTSILKRITIYKQTISTTVTSDLPNLIMGRGTGSWAIDTNYMDGRNRKLHYPHNMALECLYEFGMLGATLWLSIFLIGFNRAKYHLKHHIGLASYFIFMLFINEIFVSSVSSDIGGNTWLFIALGLACSQHDVDVTEVAN